jgi:hypothetical protein
VRLLWILFGLNLAGIGFLVAGLAYSDLVHRLRLRSHRRRSGRRRGYLDLVRRS